MRTGGDVFADESGGGGGGGRGFFGAWRMDGKFVVGELVADVAGVVGAVVGRDDGGSEEVVNVDEG